MKKILRNLAQCDMKTFSGPKMFLDFVVSQCQQICYQGWIQEFQWRLDYIFCYYTSNATKQNKKAAVLKIVFPFQWARLLSNSREDVASHPIHPIVSPLLRHPIISKILGWLIGFQYTCSFLLACNCSQTMTSNPFFDRHFLIISFIK